MSAPHRSRRPLISLMFSLPSGAHTHAHRRTHVVGRRVGERADLVVARLADDAPLVLVARHARLAAVGVRPEFGFVAPKAQGERQQPMR